LHVGLPWIERNMHFESAVAGGGNEQEQEKKSNSIVFIIFDEIDS